MRKKIMDSNLLRDKYSRLSVLVCGDMCLDKDLIGGYSGFSREKEQLPIFRTDIEKYNPGGGGNLSVCFSALGVKTIIAGFWGNEDDINRYILESSFRKRNIDISGMVAGSRTPTYGKIYLRNGIHIYRIDLTSEPIPESAIDKLVDKVKALIDSVDFVACADYEEANDYGVCAEKVLEIVSNSPLPKFGTSRARIQNFKNFNYLLQNAKELTDQTQLAKSAELPLIVKDFLVRLGVREMIVTMGGKGATVYHLGSNGLNTMPVGSVELTDNIDPCGCGDMFYAAYSSSIMAGFDMETSIRIANSAARVVARKLFGTGQATPEEIAEEYEVLYLEG
jgi:D-beta-D-heptose 7-phosphate kinase / D-beta-D-heptose 1-phosphate adenosyltransferase